jgi:hypothetical protein
MTAEMIARLEYGRSVALADLPPARSAEVRRTPAEKARILAHLVVQHAALTKEERASNGDA